ncbi:carboxypeptidase-like regulatory domain-containing protein [Chitinophaga barathri]|nr:carboxypeptidase-like regulatory domain-containing protein [Chitinophaga barathri]
MHKIIILISLFCCVAIPAAAQSAVSGTVSGRDSLPLPGVSVRNIRTNSMTVSDANGAYTIPANADDTLFFSAMGYLSMGIRADLVPADLRLRTLVTSLPGVEIVKKTRRRDSLETREEFKAAFNFRRPKVKEIVMITPAGIALNIHKLYKALSFANNRRSDTFKGRLIKYEQDRYIDERFSTELVTSRTGLTGDSLVQFMNHHRPDYKFAVEASDYDFILFIINACTKFRQGEVSVP